MQIRHGYIVREVLDVNIVVGIGADAYRPNCIMSLNDTGLFLWHELENGAEKETLIEKLTAEYEVDEETARRDVESFLAQLREKDLIDE